MSYPINYPTPQGANVQIFTAGVTTSVNPRSWVKPQGASMVWFTLIGAGGAGGDVSTDASAGNSYGGGGGSGAVTTCMIPAFLIPDQLVVRVFLGDSGPGGDTTIGYQQKLGSAYTLLSAEGGGKGGSGNSMGGVTSIGTAGVAGAATPSNGFSAAGIYQSIAGQNGRAGNSNQITSTTTFLQGGTGGGASSAASQYGYSRANLNTAAQMGYGVLSPILVSVASTEADNQYPGSLSPRESRNGFGCGGGGAFSTAASDTRYGSVGGDGLCVIVTW